MLDVSLIAPDRERPLRREEYDRLVELGVFEDERIELLGGRMIEKAPQGPRHAEIIRRLTKWLVIALADRTAVNIQAPFAATDDSEPEPDTAVVPTGDYSAGHPQRALLIIEVAQTSLRKDRLVKAGIYAAAKAPEYWIIDLEQGVVEVFRDPHEGSYRWAQMLRAEGELVPSAFPDLRITVDALLR